MMHLIAIFLLLFFKMSFSMDPRLHQTKGLHLRLVPSTDYRPNLIGEYQHSAFKKQRTEEIYKNNEYVEDFPLDTIDLLLHQYPISRNTFNYVMQNSPYIFPDIEKGPVKFVNVPMYFKTGLNRLDGLDIIKYAIGLVEQKNTCCIATPKKEAMLFLNSDYEFTSCIVSHEVVGIELQVLNAKEVMDIYSICKKASHPQKKMFNFYDAKPENLVKGKDGLLYIIDTGKEGFHEYKKENFKFDIAERIKYNFHGKLTDQADQFLVNKLKKHGP
jgi:hypothetical protein